MPNIQRADYSSSNAVALVTAVLLLFMGGLAGAGLMWAFG
jgi:hypothetical protein